MAKIAINKLARRHTEKSRFPHFIGTDEELVALVEQNLPLKRESHKKGSFIVPVPVTLDNNVMFYTTITKINQSHLFRTEVVSKHKGDTPRISTTVYSHKPMGASAEIVLYTHELLKEYGKNSTDADYEIMAILVSPDSQSFPQHPYDLLRIYRSNPQAFSEKYSIADIMRSIDYWSQHAYIRDPSKQTALGRIDPDIVELLLSNEKTQAIKHYQNRTGCSFKAAKTYIDSAEKMLIERGYSIGELA